MSSDSYQCSAEAIFFQDARSQAIVGSPEMNQPEKAILIVPSNEKLVALCS
jgi:hypothetical protein